MGNVKLFVGVLLTVSAASWKCVRGQEYDDMTKLRSDLLVNYHSDVRPLNNQSHSMTVSISLYLYNVLEVDSVRGVITLVLSLMCSWVDQRLVWDPAMYGGINNVLYYQYELWKPPMVLGTPVAFTAMWNSKFHINVSPNGFAWMNTGDVVESSCSFNMKYWPFDKQVCDVGFLPMDYPMDQLNVTTMDPAIVLYTDRNQEWIIEKTEHYQSTTYGLYETRFRFYLKRQSMFYVMAIILPIAGMNVVTSLVFLLPSESGERVSYSITIMLSLAVFLTVVSDEMPKTSDPVSLICTFLLSGIIISLISMVIVIWNMRLQYRNKNQPIGAFYKLLVKMTKFKPSFNSNRVHDLETEVIKNSQETNQSKLDSNFKDNSKSKITNLEKAGILLVASLDQGGDGDTQGREEIEWRDVSDAVDMVTFIAITVFSVIGSLVLLLYMALASDYVLPDTV